MAQNIRIEKIGTLSQNAGVLSLGPSIIKIGGQQYSTPSLSRPIALDVTMVANSRYQVYAVLSGGVPTLKISANENSVGPVSFAGWKLVGSFYANGMSPVAFGSFVTIEGSQETGYISYIPTGSWTVNATYSGFWKLSGNTLWMNSKVVTSGAPNNVPLLISVPTGFFINTSAVVSGKHGLSYTEDYSAVGYDGMVYLASSTSVGVSVIVTGSSYAGNTAVTPTVPFTFSTNDFATVYIPAPISGFTTSIKDL